MLKLRFPNEVRLRTKSVPRQAVAPLFHGSVIYPIGLYPNQSLGNSRLDGLVLRATVEVHGKGPELHNQTPSRLFQKKKRNADVPLSCLFNRRTSPSEPLYSLMGNCCSGTATVPSPPSPPRPVAGSVTTALVPSPPEAEDVLAASSQPRSRTTSVPKLHSGVSSQDSNSRIRVVSAPQPRRSKSSQPQNARTRPQPVASSNRNRLDYSSGLVGESDD